MINLKQLPVTTKEQFIEYKQSAKEFVKATGYYHDMRWDAELILTEYLAYLDGYTIRSKKETNETKTYK